MKQNLSATAPYWACKQENLVQVLEGVRLMRCPNKKCQAELPGVPDGKYFDDRAKDKLPMRIRGTVSSAGYEK